MRRTACTSCLPVLLAVACHHPGGQASSSFGTLPVTTGPAEQSSSTSGGSTGPVPEDSTAAASTGTSGGGTTLVLDVGTHDLGVPGPEGCRGKIDFLFVISRDYQMSLIQDKLIAAFPEFIATIESRFADFDYHIMVVDGDAHWGSYYCNEYHCDHEYCLDPNYPCDAIDTISKCDATYGAGTVFNAGRLSTDAPCTIAGGKRYLAKGEPDLTGSFECLARAGIDGYRKIAGALVDAVSPDKTGDCNAGFLRDDALLFVSLIARHSDEGSPGEPAEWAQAVIDAKHGDPNAVVMFAISVLSPFVTDFEGCVKRPWGRLCRLLEYFPHRLYVDAAIADYGEAFEQAADMVDEACSQFIPR